MPVKNTKDSYGLLAKGLHWASALIVLGLLPLGFFMVSLDFSPFKLDLYWWHKSFGTLLFFIVWLRLLWRFINPAPAHIESHAAWERVLAKIVHVLLYAGMIGLPVSGILMSAAADFPRPFFNLFEIPDVIEGKDQALFNLMREAHEIFAYVILAAAGLHGLGAFKHHFIDKDVTLARMLPRLAAKITAPLAVLVFVCTLGTASLYAGLHMIEEFTEEAHEVAAAPQAAENAAAPENSGDSIPDETGLTHWQILKDQSSINFDVNVQGENFQGQFTDFEGEIYFDPENLAESHAEMHVSVASVVTGSDERDEYIVAPAWMNAESFPESKMTLSEFEKTSENQYVGSGFLVVRGVSLPVRVPFTLDIQGSEEGKRTADVRGSFTIERLSYEIGAGAWSDPKTVANEVTVSVSLKAKGE